ncbi:MAG: relaxase/mobilization nuclease domain-containing protein [Chitinophaga sp.]|uniref:relaxase/mobilization nuclease domain-containing protein n=1 Tax=Chitinophaga sp. TaxID=1869181 RepID=UPI001B24D0ED|nr:relaxase/mobilization nuclease domain-containing protein [Chitinophaga sp.]MBO9732611.1 relaxase/mobilization nuclease domain-containing protein [Chitinophaga sp.]
MISKVITGSSFYGCCRYICEDENRAIVLAAEGVRDYDYRLMAHDFEAQRKDLPGKKKAVFHGILSFYPEESLSDDALETIAREYLEKIGMSDTQFAIAKHIDKKHLHLHIIANFVGNKRKAIRDSWIGLRGKKAAQELTMRYQLVPAEKKNLSLTNVESLNTEEAIRYEIYNAIQKKLQLARSLSGLIDSLIKSGIDIQYKYKSGTRELQGISFKKGLYCFKGSKIDRKFSIAGLQKIIQENNQKQTQKRRLRRGI